MEGSLFAPLMNSSRDSLPENNQNRNDLFIIHIYVHSIKLKKKEAYIPKQCEIKCNTLVKKILKQEMFLHLSGKCDCVGSINILSEIITISGLISYAYLVASLVQRLYNTNGTSKYVPHLTKRWQC